MKRRGLARGTGAALAAAWLATCAPAGASSVTPGSSAGAAPAAPAAPACRPDPLPGRTLYLRGTMNSWNAVETQKFTWACSRWELVTRLEGEHRFKLADEGWSPDADFGRPGTAPARAVPPPLRAQPLARRGAEIPYRFTAGVHRLTVTMSANHTPQLRIEPCPHPAPFGDTVLYLRGTMNNWAALDGYAFQYSCDAYYLNVELSGRHEFKVADAAWSPATTVGRGGDARANFEQRFSGAHTLRLVMAGGRPQLSVGPRSFADPNALPVSDPVALSLRFDSRDAAHKRPFGAITPGTTVHYAVTALPGVQRLTLVVERRRLEGNQEILEYTETARVPMARSDDGPRPTGHERWVAQHRFDEVAVHGWWFEAEIGGRRYVLQNNADAVYWTREKGSNGRAAVAEVTGPAPHPRSIRRLRQTVFAADFAVPDYAPDIVYYYVFPERFRNGDKRNDPRPGTRRWHDHDVEFHDKWLSRPYRPGSGDGSDRHFNNDFFGGDLAGLIDKLDHIQQLGANTLYLTPIFHAASNHKYDTADYLRVDPAFGTNEDFQRLTREAARRGMRVILDTSLNHTGADSVYFDRWGNFGGRGAFSGSRIRRDSPYASWFTFDATQKDPDKQFTGWVGVIDLPELDKSNRALRRFFYGGPEGVMQRWLDLGAAGWRMDVAPWVSDDFWREWRAAIKAHRPDALTVAETWFDASKYFLGDMFDSTMNYIFRNAVLDYARGEKATQIYPSIELMREAYPPQAFFALMNLLSSHDQARSLHVLGWHDDDPRKPATAAQIALAKQRYRLALLWQMTFPGAPAVYYGDEVGLHGGDDPYNRYPFPWPDEGGRPDMELFAEFQRLIALRHAQPVLRRGTLDAPLVLDDHAIVWLRRLPAGAAAPEGAARWALVALNNAGQPREVSLTLPADAPAAWRDALQDGGAQRAADGSLSLTLPALGGRVLLERAAAPPR